MKRLTVAVLTAGLMTAPATTVVQAGRAGSGWAISPSPEAGTPLGPLADLSCPAANACTAVGTYVDRAGLQVTFAQNWNGTVWSVQPITNPAGAVASSLTGVSCTTAAQCVAVGAYLDAGGLLHPLAEQWNGSTWTVLAAASPVGTFGASLSRVVCVAATACTAVGFAVSDHAGNHATLAERWNGTVWSINSTPNPSGGGSLSGVACSAVNACTAVGSNVGTATLAERWNGAKWTMQVTPNPGGSTMNALAAVSCPAATACVAVGSAVFAGTTATLSEFWNGTAWAIHSTPNPVGGTGSLAAVSCSSANACTAVGAGSTATIPGILAVRWNGSAWAIQPTPKPAGASNSGLSGVVCGTASACTAVGSLARGPGIHLSVAEHWDGAAWVIQPTPNAMGGAASALAAVSCPAALTCEAVGSAVNSAGVSVPLAARWNGTTWAFQRTPNPTGSLGTSLAAVACSSPTACTAVGSYATSLSSTAVLIERWNGTAWAVQPAPSPTGSASSSLSGVSCPAAIACTAVGSYRGGPGAPLLVEHWDGTTWAVQSAPLPPAATDGSLAAVSCPAAAACTAVGSSSGTAGTTVLAERWEGTAWAIQTTPDPAGGLGALLQAVACPASTVCMAAGYSVDASLNHVTLAERWDGTAWTITPTANAAGSSDNRLSGVACPAAAVCTTVGASANDISGSGSVPLAERWNGATWAIQATPASPGATDSSLFGAACASVTACMAVGIADRFRLGDFSSATTLAAVYSG